MTAEPPGKKQRLHDGIAETIDRYIEKLRNTENNLNPILEDSIFKPIPLIKVYVGHIKDQKDISKAILILNEKIPLKELQHLKRARKKEIVLCPSHFLSGMSSIQEYIECNVFELKDVFEYFKELDVPFLPPKIKKQHKETIKIWPCHFHPNKYLEKAFSGQFFPDGELKQHRTFMQMVFEVMKWYLKDVDLNLDGDYIIRTLNAAVVVDPVNLSVVAVSFDNRQDHPVQHAAMLAIDNVAKTQNGGAWFASNKERDTNLTSLGIDEELRCYLKKKFPNNYFGARKFIRKSDMTNEDYNENGTDGPYLCTNYNIYLLREPCLMCSMGLLHARAKRIFFSFENNNFGALTSKTKLHTLSSLNHHFEVFTGFL